MRKITNDIFNEAAKDDLGKVSFDLAAIAPAMLGFATGRDMGRDIGLQEGRATNKRTEVARLNRANLGGDYYEQVNNMADNLNVIFTPISVLYTVPSQGQHVTIDKIEISEMNDIMKQAYMAKDENFFRNLMLNKMRLDVQHVESMFASRLLGARSAMMGAFKMASEDEIEEEYNCIENVLEYAKLVKLAQDKDELVHALSLAVPDEATIRVRLPQPVSEYTEYCTQEYDILKLASYDDLEKIAETALDKVKITFMPDRVIYSQDNLVIAQKPLVALNEEDYKAFRKKDKKYFELQLKQKRGNLTKEANETLTIKDTFKDPSLHPKIHYLILNNSFGKEWLDYDPEALIKFMETEFELTEPIDGIVLDKIMCIQNLAVNGDCLASSFIFEKTARSFNNKPINFEEWEYDLSAGELTYALQLMDELKYNDDIFDDLTNEVTKYIARATVLDDCRVICPRTDIISSELEDKFFKVLNDEIDKYILSLNEQEKAVQTALRKSVETICTIVRQEGTYDADTIELAISKARIKNPRLKQLTHDNVIANLAIDMMIDNENNELDELRKKLNI